MKMSQLIVIGKYLCRKVQILTNLNTAYFLLKWGGGVQRSKYQINENGPCLVLNQRFMVFWWSEDQIIKARKWVMLCIKSLFLGVDNPLWFDYDFINLLTIKVSDSFHLTDFINYSIDLIFTSGGLWYLEI